ncbi:MAG: hypothetical protein AAFV80_21295, partial [Bacteroidota bacterium]
RLGRHIKWMTKDSLEFGTRTVFLARTVHEKDRQFFEFQILYPKLSIKHIDCMVALSFYRLINLEVSK